MIHNFICPIQPTIPGDGDLAVSNIKLCVHEIDHCMLVNRLKLNKNCWWSPPNIYLDQELSAVNEIIHSSQKARNIGAIFDNHFHFKAHIASIWKSSIKSAI